MSKDNKTPQKTDPRAAARAVAAKQSQRNNKSKKNRRWIQLAVLAIVATIVAMIAFVVINTRSNDIADSGPLPSSSNDFGGIVLTNDGIQKDTATVDSVDINNLRKSDTDLPLGVETAEQASANGQPVRVTIFQDYNCVHCAEFERDNADVLKKLIDDGKITLEIRNVTYLDQSSPTFYSARSANAAYSVANQLSTDDFLEYQKEIFTHQGQGGLNDGEIEDIASSHGADIKSDMKDGSWRPLVNVVTSESSTNGVAGTPTVYADGQQFNTSPDAFEDWVNQIIEKKQA